ncbi:hypothetical protein O3M35_012327 [Rhynocoris fuscipes]|uniref:Uncharacterized protein n=1 Tax=Rhynocoris fuscipes TaxID=488301 RepID=A0AAW1CRZ5_9HEMI
MIRTADQKRYEPVTLFIKDNITNEIVTDIPEELTTWTQETPSLNDDEQDYTEDDQDDDEEEEEEEEAGTEGTPRILKTEQSTGRTRLYPVGRLWEKARADIWTVLSAAVNCIWSGLSIDCFKFRVMPMVKSLMGYHYSEYEPLMIASREDEEGRRRRPHHLLGLLKVMKGALAGAIGFKTLLLPVLAALAIVAGKSIMLSFASVLISAAAAWSGIKYAADRRIQAAIPDSTHPQYYMM